MSGLCTGEGFDLVGGFVKVDGFGSGLGSCLGLRVLFRVQGRV